MGADDFDDENLAPVQPLVWTQDNVDKLKTAIASGALSVSYSLAGGASRTVTYNSLDAMRALLATMIRDVRNTPTYRLAQVRSGFRRGW